MNIGIDARMISATGIGRYTKNLIENLEFLDKDNEYFIFLKKEDFKKINFNNNNFKKVLADFHWYGLSEQIKFPKLIKKNKIGLMHFPHFNIPIFYRGRFVVTIHDLTLHRHKTVKSSTKDFLTYNIKHILYKTIISRAIKKSAYIFVPSIFTKNDVLKEFKISNDKVIVTLEGGPSGHLLKTKEIDNIKSIIGGQNKFLLYVGNAYPHKNLDILLNVINDIPEDLNIVLAGRKDHFYSELEDKVKKLKLEKRIIFTDFVSDNNLVWLYKNAFAYVFPSLNEGFGLPLLEAATFGLPVVCSNSSSLPEVMGDSALYFDPKSYKEIAKKINLLSGDNNLREELILKGKERVKEFSWKEMAQKTLKIYNSIK